MRSKTIFIVFCIFILPSLFLIQVETSNSFLVYNKKNDNFTLKSSGKDSWHQLWGGAKNEWTYSLVADSTGSIYVAGDTTSFDLGESDIFLLKYNSSVNYYGIMYGVESVNVISMR